ncbi:glycosyltransferase [Phyllobacterium endophyticum]|uniref:Colanic acid biosynthesis glycosyltransferase WcaL n=1 Tax=Phyllobacterium endophyticum TaxID=1149773 RepID=A0A2P7B0G6_9HYPH|nr:glycosyltransferase [Phyllobacterium endophyticum]MBB3235387.1 colanic acid/amylovoran biosynthesis glycosyltransferase [Phyllobacterium endophyticum]PSH59941.1 colanic acid biosynthesis glycosyltransferase WcaL [Phyllobacterium endophyticum]TYR42105.1 colanic acid biosynthesis glycosyltransferase WcaL [Phyllobacterium endophyticum]
MRVGFVVDTFPSLSETFILDQVNGFVERGFEVCVICNRNALNENVGSATSSQALSGIAVQWWGSLAVFRPLLRKLPAILWDKVSTAFDILFARKLRNFDVIIAHFGNNGLRVARVLKRRHLAAPLVTIFHGRDVGRPMQDNSLWQYDVLFKQGALQLTVNDYFRTALVKAGASAEKVVVHHMGVRLAEIEYSWRSWQHGTLEFISVCRLTEKKGIEFALRALGELAASSPRLDWSYTIIGGGELQDALKQLAKDLGIADKVTFLGPRPHSEVKQRLRQAHVFILPSVTAVDGDVEGIPVSLMEAMAAGLIAVSTYHSGIPELVEDQKTGILVPEKDPPSLAAKLSWIAENPAACEHIALAARKKVESEFNADVLNGEFAQMIARLANEKSKA